MYSELRLRVRSRLGPTAKQPQQSYCAKEEYCKQNQGDVGLTTPECWRKKGELPIAGKERKV